MDPLALIPFTGALVKATLAASGAATTIGTTSSTSGYLIYAIRGKAYTKADLSSAATPTSDYATGLAFKTVLANFGSVFMVGLDHAGTVQVVQGSVVPLDGIAGSGLFINAPQFGDMPNDFCPLGYILIQAGTTANNTTGFLFGTTNWNATGITTTPVDVVGCPDRPQTS